MAGRRRGSRVRRVGSGARRDGLRLVAVAPAARDQDDDGLLAERQVLRAPLDAEHRAERGHRGPPDRHRPHRPRAHRRVLRRRVRQQDRGVDAGADCPPALAQDRQAGHDARDAAGGELLRQGASRDPGPSQVRLQERRPHRGHRSDDGSGRRPLRAVGGLHVGRRPGFADVSAGAHARPRRHHLHQHPAARSAAGPGRRAGRRVVRAGHRQGGAAARRRSARHHPPERSAGAGSVRPAAAGAAGQRLERLREGGHRQGPRGVRLGRDEGAERASATAPR